MTRYLMAATVAGLILACGNGVRADIAIDTVPIGNAGNPGEWTGESYGGYGPDLICGAVGYQYDIGKYEITAGQYCEFLNAVATTEDTYGLWNPYMWFVGKGCKILRQGPLGGYVYSVAPDRANRPVNFVSWGDAARFSNWLHNGQPTGGQDLGTTEDGSYYLNGAMSQSELQAIVREPDASWVIPSEDEWYKAAYHKNDGVTGNYFDYPTSTDDMPSNAVIDPDPGNNANFYQGGYSIGEPYWCTEVGEFENSESPYGTFGQGGNVTEWTEAIPLEIHPTVRTIRGSTFFSGSDMMQAAYHTCHQVTDEYDGIGFRLALVPEPTSLTLLAFGGMGLLLRRRRLASRRSGQQEASFHGRSVMRLTLAMLLVMTITGTASATQYLWYEVIAGDVAITSQGPGQLLDFDVALGTTVTIGAFMTDDGMGVREYGFELNTPANMIASNLDPNASSLWDSSGGSAGASPLVNSWAASPFPFPVLGWDTDSAYMIMSFDLTINRPGDIGGEFTRYAVHGDRCSIWGGYYYEAYVGSHYLPAGHLYSGIGHYVGYEFGTVISAGVPEPASLTLVGVGAVAILRRR